MRGVSKDQYCTQSPQAVPAGTASQNTQGNHGEQDAQSWVDNSFFFVVINLSYLLHIIVILQRHNDRTL